MLDADRFEAATESASRWLNEGAQPSLRSAMAELATALDLWRGPALEGFRDQPFAAPEASRLDALRVRAQTDQLRAAIALGEHSLALPQLEALVLLQPFDEQLRALQIVALYRGGRQVDALSAYRRYRRQLSREMALEPGPHLRELERAVLKQDARLLSPTWAGSLAPSSEREHLTVVPAVPASSQGLPSWTTSFVGRQAELQILAVTLEARRMVTITGPGGSGKTRLAVAAAELRPAALGAVFVEVGRLTGASRLVGALAAAFQAEGPAVSAGELARALADEPTLIILDGCEHLAAAVSALCDTLLQGSRRLRLLATSRQPLEVEGERLFDLPPMSVAVERDAPAELLSRGDAVELFLDRAQLPSGAEGIVESDLELITAICRRLEGLPLAIELAAVSARSLALPDLLERLASRISALDDAAGPVERGHQTIRGTLDWSYRLLTADQQLVLRRLGVFRGPFDIPSVEAVLAGGFSPGDEVAGLLAQLVSRSMVARRPGPTVRQYVLLEATREFALDRAAEADELALARSRHAALFFDFGTAAAGAFDGPAAPRWIAQFDLAEQDVVAAADELRRAGEVEDAALLDLAVASYALGRYRLVQIRDRLAPLGSDSRLSPATRVEAIRRQGQAEFLADDFEAAAVAFRAAGTLAAAAHLEGPRLLLQAHQAELMRAQNVDLEQILSLLGVALKEARAARAVEAEIEAQRLAAIIYWDRGELALARTGAERARRLAQRHGRVRSLADTQNTLSGILRDLGELSAAEELLEFTGAYFRAIEDPLETAYNDYSRARIALLKGDARQAIELGEESLRRFGLISESWGAAMVERLLGEAALASSDTDEAGRWLESALGHLQERGFAADIVGVSEVLARVALVEGEHLRAVEICREALAGIDPDGASRYRAPLLTTLSRAELAGGRTTAATEAAESAREAAEASGAAAAAHAAQRALADARAAALNGERE
jgi:predicted ATPase